MTRRTTNANVAVGSINAAWQDELQISPTYNRVFLLEETMQSGLTDEQNMSLALPRSAAARAIELSTRSLDRLIQAGAIKTIPAFRRRLVPVKELNRFLSDGGYVEEPVETE